MENEKLLFYDENSNKIYTEKEVRRLAYVENLRDLNDNKENIFENIIIIESVCKYLINSLKGDMKDVIKDLNENLGYCIDIYKKIENISLNIVCTNRIDIKV